jgi:tRNA-binding EMAP/Myf-like protein
MKEEPLGIVVGTIVSVEKAEGSDRLYAVRIDIGDRVVQVATSLASFFERDQLIGKQIPVKTDVPPTTIRGVKSEARFIAILGDNKEPVLLMPEKTVRNGAMVL